MIGAFAIFSWQSRHVDWPNRRRAMHNAGTLTSEPQVAILANIERMRALSAFDGDSASALRAVHAYFSAQLPPFTLAIVLVRDLAPGQCRLAGLVGADAHEHVANVDPYGQHAQLPLFDDALTTRMLAATTAVSIDVDVQARSLPFARALLDAHVLIGIPIVNGGAVDHWLVFASHVDGSFDRLPLDALVLEANLAASLVLHPLSTRALRDQSTRQRQAIEGLADVQRLLLPDNPRIRGLDYAMHWQPAETAAGDYYDLMALTHHAPPDFVDDGADIWAVMLADVSGHGAAAAMEAVQFDAILRTYEGDEESGPAGAITYANRYFFSRRTRHHFMTALGVLYRPDLRRITYVNAGHPPLLHRRGNAVHVRDHKGDIPIGILRDHVWENTHVDVEAGDLLVLHTDGIVEARDAAGVPFGDARLIELIAHGPDDPALLLESLRAALFAHQGSTIGVDDQTLLVLRIL